MSYKLHIENVNGFGVIVPLEGTIINGHTIQEYEKIQNRIAELEQQIDAMATFPKSDPYAPSVPDWIAPGKWIVFDGKDRHTKIKSVSPEYVYYTNGEYNSIEYVKRYAKPFAPPPCPELPYRFSETYKGKITFGNVHLPLESWIAAAKLTDKADLINISLPQLEAIRDWREKWGTE